MIYLHENGVTVVATDEAKRGKVYELNGEKYYVARGKSIDKLIEKIKLNKTSKKVTLGGCFIEEINETIIISRENSFSEIRFLSKLKSVVIFLLSLE